ncbi:hypothetical protein [Micromonospora sp. NPDC007220]|uniref:hypothetical protein n=1 Tax=Micromonospora sp. NPDC007220 TaxID=3154318 RepID=UPI0034113A6F
MVGRDVRVAEPWNRFVAVLAGLTQPWSSGPVEGQVNRIKTIKRQMYGRANLDSSANES